MTLVKEELDELEQREVPATRNVILDTTLLVFIVSDPINIKKNRDYEEFDTLETRRWLRSRMGQWSPIDFSLANLPFSLE